MLAAYLLSASGFGYWLDSGEFVAAAADFGISHPPGHPLASIVLGSAQWLPLGALSFRVALICAALGAVAAVALFFAMETSLELGEAVSEKLRTPVSLFATWWIAGSQAWWFQSVRPEVYSLQAALSFIAIERLLRASVNVQRDPQEGDRRPLLHAALALGLAFANHHFLALILIPPALLLLVGIVRNVGWRPLGSSLAFFGAGLLTYVFLPLRAIAKPYLALGDPRTPARFFWVVSAEAFQKSLSPAKPSAFGPELAEVLLKMLEDLRAVPLLVALLGASLMCRVGATRRFGFFWLSVLCLTVLGRAALGFVEGNPDAAGYLMPAYGALGVFCAFAIGLLLSALDDALEQSPRFVPSLAMGLALLGLLQFPLTARSASLAHFVDTDVFDDGLRRALPPRAIVLAYNPSTIFRFWGGEAEERNRPDVALIPMPFLSYPKMVEQLVDADPEIKPLLRDAMLEGTLNPSELQSIAALRPVFVEMDVRVPAALFESLRPEQLYHRVIGPEGEREDREAYRRWWEDLYARIAKPLDPQTKRQRLWRHYADALHFAATGETDDARRATGAALAIDPQSEELQKLAEALGQSPAGERLDIEAFRLR